MTDADICEIVALGSVLFEHCIAWWCFTITAGSDGRQLSDEEEITATIGCVPPVGCRICLLRLTAVTGDP